MSGSKGRIVGPNHRLRFPGRGPALDDIDKRSYQLRLCTLQANL